jgi:signal peptidase I
MNTNIPLRPRKPGRALVSGLAMPGLGQIYNGDLVKGLCFFVLFSVTPLLTLELTAVLPSRLLLQGSIASMLLTIGVYILAAYRAYRAAKNHGEGYLLKPFNRSYFYVSLWVVCALCMTGSIFTYTQNHVIQFCRIASGSMQPSLEPGDFVIIDKTYYRHASPRPGDIILFVYPDDRSKLYIKRIEALPGDTIRSSAESAAIIVPHGHVFVLGDNREHAEDSRVFGAIPLTDVLGKARQVYFSWNTSGIQWQRAGMVLN